MHTLKTLALAALLLAAVGGRPAPAQTLPASPTVAVLNPYSPTVLANASGDSAKSNRLRIGPEIGAFFPFSGKTRDRFGSTWFSFGLGFGAVGPVPTEGGVAFDLHLLYQKKGDNHALVAPIGIAYRKALGEGPGTVPYAGVDADLYLADIRSVQDNVKSGLRTGAGGGVFAGLNFGDSGYLEARYQAVSHIKGFDFSGLSLTAGLRF